MIRLDLLVMTLRILCTVQLLLLLNTVQALYTLIDDQGKIYIYSISTAASAKFWTGRQDS